MLKELMAYTFLHAWVLWLIPVLWILFGVWYYFLANKRFATTTLSSTKSIENHSSLRGKLTAITPFLRLIALSFILVALARPQSISTDEKVSTYGIDIVISVDISGSMLAEDFQPNRMEAAKNTALEFVDMRPGDRMGVTVFSGESFTLVPLTTDHGLLKDLLRTTHTGMVEDGTAIGDGLATAVNRLRESDAISKVIVLLTDGINNTGVIDPLTAAEIARLHNIRVYTVGVGSDGPVPYPFEGPFGIQYRDVEIPVDEELLQEIAQMTGGRYFWADNKMALEEVYNEIDQMERSKIDVMEFARKTDEYLPFLLLAMLVAGLEFLLRQTLLKVTT